MQTTECKLIVVFCGEESASNAKLDYAVFLILCTGAGGAMCDGVTLLKFHLRQTQLTGWQGRGWSRRTMDMLTSMYFANEGADCVMTMLQC